MTSARRAYIAHLCWLIQMARARERLKYCCGGCGRFRRCPRSLNDD